MIPVEMELFGKNLGGLARAKGTAGDKSFHFHPILIQKSSHSSRFNIPFTC